MVKYIGDSNIKEVELINYNSKNDKNIYVAFCKNVNNIKIVNLPNVERIIIGNNISLSSIYIENCVNLVSLDLNNISTNNIVVNNCKNLKNLTIQNCNFKVIPFSLGKLESLYVLNCLYITQLTNFVDRFCKKYQQLSNLKQLTIENNPLLEKIQVSKKLQRLTINTCPLLICDFDIDKLSYVNLSNMQQRIILPYKSPHLDIRLENSPNVTY